MIAKQSSAPTRHGVHYVALKHLSAITTLVLALMSTAASVNTRSAVRPKLQPGSSIAQAIRNEHAQGNTRPKFTLIGQVDGTSGSTEDKFFAVNVREPVQAVTSETTFSAFHGPPERVGELVSTILVADNGPDSEDEGTIGIISIDKETDEVNGIVQKKSGEKLKFIQKKGKKSKAFEAPEFFPPAWACGVATEERRSLSVEEIHDMHEERDHEERDHPHHHNEKINQAFAYLSENLRGSKIQAGKRRKLQTTESYHYQVDLFVEVDQELENANDSTEKMIEYVNAIITGANTIFEVRIKRCC